MERKEQHGELMKAQHDNSSRFSNAVVDMFAEYSPQPACLIDSSEGVLSLQLMITYTQNLILQVID